MGGLPLAGPGSALLAGSGGKVAGPRASGNASIGTLARSPRPSWRPIRNAACVAMREIRRSSASNQSRGLPISRWSLPPIRLPPSSCTVQVMSIWTSSPASRVATVALMRFRARAGAGVATMP
ncbi:hypothetical protein FQU96_29015 [Reyranella sp. CPCC 100927]|nr:hypothetical protein FQU96_29015 [Reyranella sp. CPCC 100927]